MTTEIIRIIAELKYHTNLLHDIKNNERAIHYAADQIAGLANYLKELAKK